MGQTVSYMGLAKFVRDRLSPLNQTQLAELTGFSDKFIGELLNGMRNLSPEGCDVIARKLKMSVEDRGKLHIHAARFEALI